MMRWAKQKVPGPVDPSGQRLIGLTREGNEPIFALPGHSLLLSANGGGKTTRGAMPWLFSLLSSSPDEAILCLDSKNGEMAIQAAEMAARMGRKVAVIDDMGVWPELAQYRVSPNPFGAAVSAYLRDPRDVLFATETINTALISEPARADAKDKYWRDYAHAYARNERFDALRAEKIIRDIYTAIQGRSMNQTREALMAAEKELPDTARSIAFAHADSIPARSRRVRPCPSTRPMTGWQCGLPGNWVSPNRAPKP